MPNSLIHERVWHWRNGLRPMPLLSNETCKQTRELFLPVSSAMEATRILNKLKKNGIRAESKTTHSKHDIIPSGSLIVYASMSDLKKDIDNIKKLENYIKEQGGEFPAEEKQSPRVSFFSKLFGRGGK